MQITIILDTDSATDLAALAALVASLGGRTVVTVPQQLAPDGYLVDTTGGRPPVPTAVPELPNTTSEALLRQEANRAAGNPTGQSSAGTEPSVFDSSGLRWDERIHGKSGDGTLPTNADGTWRKRRGVDDATVAAVTAELRATGGNAPPAPDAPATTPPPPADTAPVTSAATSAVDAPPPPVAEAPAPPPAASASGGRFETFGAFVTAVNARGLNYAALNALSAENFQVPEFRNMKDYPQHWDMFALLAGVE